MRLNSLAGRLIAAATLWALVALVAAGLILTSLYRTTVEHAFDERLDVYLQTLVGALAAQDPTQPFSDPGNLGEQRFELLYSGWYWQVRDAATPQGAARLRARSFPTPSTSPRRHRHEGPERAHLRRARRARQPVAALPQPDGDVRRPRAGRSSSLPATPASSGTQIAAFGTSVAITLAVFGIGLIIATLIQIRWGLRPLDDVRRALAELRGGKQTRVEGTFPAGNRPAGQGVERGS